MKNVIKLAKASFDKPNIFQDSLNRILSQQLTHGRSYIAHDTSITFIISKEGKSFERYDLSGVSFQGCITFYRFLFQLICE